MATVLLQIPGVPMCPAGDSCSFPDRVHTKAIGLSVGSLRQRWPEMKHRMRRQFMASVLIFTRALYKARAVSLAVETMPAQALG